MKLYLTTNIIPDISELSTFYIEPVVNNVDDVLRPVWNHYHREFWGNFNQVRRYAPLSGYDARCFITSYTNLQSVGITGQYGMYDMVDNDNIIDFYAGVPAGLNKRAINNGFKTNLAWIVVHELCHGMCQVLKRHDATHEMDERGELQAFYFELYNELLKTKVSLLQRVLHLLGVITSYGK